MENQVHGNRCFGKKGADLVLKVPKGTVIKDFETGKIICDLSQDNQKELVLRVNNIIKRVYQSTESKILNYLDYSIDLDKRIVSVKDKPIKLTTLEFDLLILLVENINKSFSREDILNAVWGNDYFGSDRAVDDLVRRLRKKMPLLNVNTIYGYGYRLSA